MKIVKKNWAYDSDSDIAYHAIEELNEYEFAGKVDFAYCPVFLYDAENCITINGVVGRTETPKMVILDDSEIKEVANIQSKSTVAVLLSRNYDLQDFFNDHKNAKCIVFFLGTGYTIFHEGYRIRVYIDE